MVVVPECSLRLEVVAAGVNVGPVVIFKLPRAEPISRPTVGFRSVVAIVNVRDDVGTAEALHNVGQTVVDAAKNRLAVAAHERHAWHRTLVRRHDARSELRVGAGERLANVHIEELDRRKLVIALVSGGDRQWIESRPRWKWSCVAREWEALKPRNRCGACRWIGAQRVLTTRMDCERTGRECRTADKVAA